jgi:hypothetical protein
VKLLREGTNGPLGNVGNRGANAQNKEPMITTIYTLKIFMLPCYHLNIKILTFFISGKFD